MEAQDLNSHQQRPLSVMIMAQPTAGDEISLADLWRVFARRRVAFYSTFVVVVGISLAYAILATPVYESVAWLRAPSPVMLDGLVDQGVSPKAAFGDLVGNLRSYALRRHYFDTHKLANILAPGYKPTDLDQIFDEFNKALVVHGNARDNTRISIDLKGKNAHLVASWLNGFVAEVNAATAKSLTNDVINQLKDKEASVRDEIAAKRKVAYQRRNDRIAVLEDAERVAKRAGIKNIAMAVQRQGAEASRTSFPLLYLMGTKVLKARLSVLKKRTDDDPFIPGLRDLQERLRILENIHIDPSLISAVRIDQPAHVPERPIKPKRYLIVLLGMFGGVVLGVFAALLVEFLAKNREQESGAVSN